MRLTWELILGIAGGIVVLFNACKVLISLTDPHKKLRERVDKHDELFKNDHKRLIETEETNRLLCKSMIALLEHEITGNGIEKLKKTKTELQEYLINRQ